jgi:hypothetical protein
LNNAQRNLILGLLCISAVGLSAWTLDFSFFSRGYTGLVEIPLPLSQGRNIFQICQTGYSPGVSVLLGMVMPMFLVAVAAFIDLGQPEGWLKKGWKRLRPIWWEAFVVLCVVGMLIGFARYMWNSFPNESAWAGGSL